MVLHRKFLNQPMQTNAANTCNPTSPLIGNQCPNSSLTFNPWTAPNSNIDTHQVSKTMRKHNEISFFGKLLRHAMLPSDSALSQHKIQNTPPDAHPTFPPRHQSQPFWLSNEHPKATKCQKSIGFKAYPAWLWLHTVNPLSPTNCHQIVDKEPSQRHHVGTKSHQWLTTWAPTCFQLMQNHLFL